MLLLRYIVTVIVSLQKRFGTHMYHCIVVVT